MVQECSWYDTMIIPRPILYFSQVRVRTYLTTHVKRKKKEEGRTYIHVFPSFIFLFFKQVIAQKLNKTKLGSTLLGGFPSEVAISVASFFGDQSYLVSV